ncbi:MAG: hypothetical protein ACFB0E_20570 [Leptolyngbyaceae cyanobacterium]
MAKMSREDALRRIDAIREKYDSSAYKIHTKNEACTRLLVIDEILNLLGWDKEDYNPESPTASGFIDYLLSINGTPRLIVEAKRGNATFNKARYSLRDVDYTLNYFKKAYGARFKQVLDQATKYAFETSVHYTVLTNGSEWFLAQVIASPGQKSENLRGFYFGNLLSKESDFDLFWELLSKHQVESGSLEERLYALNYQPTQDVQIAAQQFGTIQWKRTTEFDEIREFYGDFFGPIIGSRLNKMLQKCYIENTKLSQFERDLKHVLQDSTPLFMPEQTQDIDYTKGKAIIDESAQASSGKVILLVGSVGCGKSTFVSKVVLEANQKNNGEGNSILSRTAIIRIDLINESTSIKEEVEPLLWSYIIEEWREYEARKKQNSYSRENLRKLFWRELRDFGEGEFSGLSEEKFQEKEAEYLFDLKNNHYLFFSRCWKQYHKEGTGVVVILDDIDRTSEELQSKVYSFAHKLATKTGVTVILTLREFTFFRAKESGFLDIRDDKYLHLSSPNLERVISKRIKYVENHFDADYRTKEWRRQNKYQAKKKSSLVYSNTLKSNLLDSKTGRDILSILSSVSWHNVRDFLDILGRVHSQLGKNGEPWDESEVISTLMILNDYDLAPAIPNIFRPAYRNFQSYFLKIRITLMLLYGIKPGESRSGVKFYRLANFCRLYGYQTLWIKESIQELVQDRLLECLEAPISQDFTKTYRLNDNHTFRISPLATVLLKKLIFRPIYLCLIGNELPFYDNEKYNHYCVEFKRLIDSLDFQKLERSAIDLLLNSTEISDIVSSYLVEMYDLEQPANRQILNLTEISSTENKLGEIIDFYANYRSSYILGCKSNATDLSNSTVEVSHSTKTSIKKNTKSKKKVNKVGTSNGIEQLELPFFGERHNSNPENVQSGSHITEKISGLSIIKSETVRIDNDFDKHDREYKEFDSRLPIPEDIDTLKIDNSEYIPLIFWTLVYLKEKGECENNGVKITNIMNEFLLGERDKKWPNNVSRALRSKKLMSQDWLKIIEKPTSNLFGIKDNWKSYWRKYFGDEPPKL